MDRRCVDEERGDPDALEGLLERVQDAGIATGQSAREHGNRKHQVPTRPRTGSEDM